MAETNTNLAHIDLAHAELVRKLCKSGEQIKQEIAPEAMDLLHVTSKLIQEASELGDSIYKYAYYNKPLGEPEIANISEELGDMEFYMERIRALLSIDRYDTLLANISKLNKRYPDGYTNKSAIERKDKES